MIPTIFNRISNKFDLKKYTKKFPKLRAIKLNYRKIKIIPKPLFEGDNINALDNINVLKGCQHYKCLERIPRRKMQREGKVPSCSIEFVC